MDEYRTDPLELAVYSQICSHEGIRARDLEKLVNADRHRINQYLYRSVFMQELCYRDDDYLWHGLIRQKRPHDGLGDFCAWWGSAGEFLSLPEEEWFSDLLEGCRRIGRNTNDTRGLFHSFRDCRRVMVQLLDDLAGVCRPDWELCFELKIHKARYLRIFADVLVITQDRVFSLEFKMKDRIDPGEVLQAAKYVPWLEVIFGPRYDVIPCLVLTRAADLYEHVPLGIADAVMPVCSGDMLFNLFDEYLNFLQK